MKRTRTRGSAIRLIALVCILALTPLVQAQSGSGPTWTQLNPTNPPPNGTNGSGSSSAVYDGANNLMIQYGGQSGDKIYLLSHANGLGGTAAWSQYSAPNGPARNTPTVVYDPLSNQLILFGGFDLNDAWSLSYANGIGGVPTWSPLSPAGNLPPGRHYHTAVYNANSNRMIVFGGTQENQAPMNDVWVLQNANGNGGTPTWTHLTPGNATLYGRYGHTAVYDVASNRMIVFGGQGPAGYVSGAPAFLNDVWVLSNADGTGGTPTWTQLTPSGSPPSPKFGASAAYDPATNRLIVFGGFNCPAAGGSCVTSNDVWVLSNANGQGGTAVWIQLSPTGSLPSPRYASSSIYDPVTNRMTVFDGGTGTSGLNDTWVLVGANGVVYAAQIQPPINADGSSVFNSRRGVVPVKFALTYLGQSTCDLPAATIAVTRTAGAVVGTVNESDYIQQADSGSNFRVSDCQYVYNLSASSLGPGTYRVDIKINGTVVGSGTFQLQ